MPEIRNLFPPGHFYSPICDPTDLREREDEIWPPKGNSDGAVDYNSGGQRSLLRELSLYRDGIDFPSAPSTDPTRYSYSNDQFPCLDAEVLFCMIRHLKPEKIVEVGSGFSTLIMAEVNRRYFEGAIQLRCVEPYPRQFLVDGVPGVSQLIRKKVQAVESGVFTALGAGDILFIDTSHVSKTGSDVNHIVFNILPVLSEGVFVHIHDIFLPDEYPKRWAIDEGRNWNEQYLIRAFLQFNQAFEIAFGAYYMASRHAEEILSVFPRASQFGFGGSLWLRRR
jgi:hypothetical protein